MAGSRAALIGEEVQHVDRDAVGIALLRDAVPVVQDVKAFGAGAAVEARDHAIEENLLAAGAEAVGAHRIAQRQERGAERLSGEPVDDLPANGALQGGADKTARLFER